MKKFFSDIKNLFSRGEKTTLQKQLRMIIIFVLVAAIGTGVYFAAIYPSIKKENELPPLLDGEEYYNNNILLVPYTTRDLMKCIEVHNEYGDYVLDSAETENGGSTFVLRGNENLSMNANSIASAAVASGVVYSTKINDMQRINENATPADLKQYGLTEDAREYAWFRVTKKDGSSYKIIVGDLIPSGNAYYGMVEGRENVIYAVSSSCVIFKSKSTAYINTTVSNSLGQSVVAIEDFSILRYSGDKRDLIIRLKTKDTTGVENATSGYELVYPAAYYLNDDKFGYSVINNITTVSAAEIMEYGADIFKEEVYTKYGLDLDPERLENVTDKNHAIVSYTCIISGSGGENVQVSNVLYMSKSFTDSEDGEKYYYVYSPDFEVIAKVLADTLEFADWNIAAFTSDRMYYNYIGTCDFFELRNLAANKGVRYTFSGTEKNFNVKVTEAGEGSAPIIGKDGKPREFNVEYTPDDFGGKYSGEFENFRNLYLVLITRSFDIAANPDGRDVSEDPALSVTISCTPKDLAKSFVIFDEDGNRLRDSKGNTLYARYRGGYLICENAKATSKDGETYDYGTLYYDETAGRFFQKKVDSNDGELKPVNLAYDDDYNVVIRRFVSASYNVTAEYTKTISTYDFYYIYETYTDADGNEKKVISQTEMYVVPTVTTIKYEISTETGTKELSRETVTAEKGMIMRKPAIDKLFEDSDKVIDGIEIGAYEAN